jgi:hypothetical protein
VAGYFDTVFCFSGLHVILVLRTQMFDPGRRAERSRRGLRAAFRCQLRSAPLATAVRLRTAATGHRCDKPPNGTPNCVPCHRVSNNLVSSNNTISETPVQKCEQNVAPKVSVTSWFGVQTVSHQHRTGGKNAPQKGTEGGQLGARAASLKQTPSKWLASA